MPSLPPFFREDTALMLESSLTCCATSFVLCVLLLVTIVSGKALRSLLSPFFHVDLAFDFSRSRLAFFGLFGSMVLSSLFSGLY